MYMILKGKNNNSKGKIWVPVMFQTLCLKLYRSYCIWSADSKKNPQSALHTTDQGLLMFSGVY